MLEHEHRIAGVEPGFDRPVIASLGGTT